jgi:hypothetical protein
VENLARIGKLMYFNANCLCEAAPTASPNLSPITTRSHIYFGMARRKRQRPEQPPTPPGLPDIPEGAEKQKIYYCDDLVWFVNGRSACAYVATSLLTSKKDDTGTWEKGKVVDIRGVSGSTLFPFVTHLPTYITHAVLDPKTANCPR